MWKLWQQQQIQCICTVRNFAGDLLRRINACLRMARGACRTKGGMDRIRRTRMGRLIDDNLPASLLSNESLFGACRRLRSAHKTRGTSKNSNNSNRYNNYGHNDRHYRLVPTATNRATQNRQAYKMSENITIKLESQSETLQ